MGLIYDAKLFYGSHILCVVASVTKVQYEDGAGAESQLLSFVISLVFLYALHDTQNFG